MPNQNNNVKKFNNKILTSRVRNILKLLEDGNYPAKIARLLGLSRQQVHYYIKKLLELGYLEKTEGKPTFYTLTLLGKKFLEQVERCCFGRVVRLHNVVLKFPVLRGPVKRIDWRRVGLRNWGQLLGFEFGCRVRKNPNSLEVFPEVVEGDNPYELLLRAIDQAYRVAERLEEKFGMVLGRPSIGRKPHFGVYDPVVGQFSKFMEFSDDVGKVDESEGYGEIDWFSPEFAKNYLLTFTTLPDEVSRVKKQLDVLSQGQAVLDQKVSRLLDAVVLQTASVNRLVKVLEESRLESREQVKVLLRVLYTFMAKRKRKKRRVEKKKKGRFGFVKGLFKRFSK